MAITLISVEQAHALQANGLPLFDIREPAEWAASGVPYGARTVTKSELERDTCHHITGPEQAFMLSCGGGKRAPSCAEALAGQGYLTIYVVQEGMRGWLASGLPVQAYVADDFTLRYARQIQLPQIGLSGQQRLAKARVLMVGAGGLGSPCAFYLAAAGVGHLTLIDDDTVALSNLQRQILHTNDNIGELKVNSAKARLNALNPSIDVEIHNDRVTRSNFSNYIKNIDLVIDGTDNFNTRYVISDACSELGIPWVYGAVYRFEGQVSVFHASKPEQRGLCYRCLFPEGDTESSAPNCTEAGVLGVAPGLIGVLQATEALKCLLDIGETLHGRLLHVDLLGMRFHETKLTADPECLACGQFAV